MGMHAEAGERLGRINRRVLIGTILDIVGFAQRFIALADEHKDLTRFARGDDAVVVDISGIGGEADDAWDPALPLREAWRRRFVRPRLLFAMLLPLAAEDAYITYRYALNLQAGNGLVYNPGEHVMGFSSPLWTLWNALGIRLVRNPVLWSRAWSLIADATTLLVLTSLIRREAGRPSAWCFAIFFSLSFGCHIHLVYSSHNGRRIPCSRSRLLTAAL